MFDAHVRLGLEGWPRRQRGAHCWAWHHPRGCWGCVVWPRQRHGEQL